MTQYYVDKNGSYLGGWDNSVMDALDEDADLDLSGGQPPVGAIEVPCAPLDARQKWLGDKWGPIPVSNEEHRQYLRNTDWYVIRMQETGEPIPADVTAKRAEARASITD